jgi:hypothetical protein
MITVYGLTDYAGEVRYVGQTCYPKPRLYELKKRHFPFEIAEMKTLEVVETNEQAAEAETLWINHYGLENLENKHRGSCVHQREFTAMVFVRLPSSIVVKLKREAGPHGSMSSVIRSMIQQALKRST